MAVLALVLFPATSFSGKVIATGEGVSKFRIGDEILGMSDWFEKGATAEFCLTNENSIVFKPRTLSHVQAAATPISALTAWQALVERAEVKSGDRVLIVGASGSVGLMAVQIARLQGGHCLRLSLGECGTAAWIAGLPKGF